MVTIINNKNILLVKNSLHEIIHWVPLIIVAGLSVKVSQVSAGKHRSVFFDQLEEERVLGTLEADGAQRRKPQQQFGESEKIVSFHYI